MINGKQIITRCFAILILCGIVLVGGYGLYMSFRDFDKSVPVVTKTDSLGRPFEINGYLFYLRNDALYDESGNMVADLSIDNNRTSKNAQVSPSLKDVQWAWGTKIKALKTIAFLDAVKRKFRSFISSQSLNLWHQVKRLRLADGSHQVIGAMMMKK